jgi:rhodanese-related sulfurtransferase
MPPENINMKKQLTSLFHLAAAAALLGAAAAIAVAQDTKTAPAAASGAAASTGPKPGYDANGHKIVNETKYNEISVPDAVKYLADHPDAIILDVRTPREWAAGHIPNSTNYSVQNDATYKDILAPLDKTKWYLVHSAAGQTHLIFCKLLKIKDAVFGLVALLCLGSTRAPACGGRRPRRPHLFLTEILMRLPCTARSVTGAPCALWNTLKRTISNTSWPLTAATALGPTPASR